MILQLSSRLTDVVVDDVREQLEARGARTTVIRGGDHTFIRCVGNATACHEIARAHSAVVRTDLADVPPLSARVDNEHRTVVRVGGRDITAIGGDCCVVIAGPCAVEGRGVLLETAWGVRARGAVLFRGGAFKPRSSPYTFQGLGEAGLALLQEARTETGLPVVTEVMDPRQIECVSAVADVLQVGARNMQNYTLLDELGRLQRPVLLKRGLAATVDEWLFAAERILSAGNPNVILCERGIRTYETVTRNTLDVGAVAAVKRMTHLPVIVDPSHAAGRRELVPALALAAVAAGADGLIVEVHPRPDQALSDGPQSLDLSQFEELMRDVSAVARAVGRSMAGSRDVAREVAA